MSNKITYAKTTDLDNKVDKDGDKVLSDNNYTTEEKEKLADLTNYDDTELKLRDERLKYYGDADIVPSDDSLFRFTTNDEYMTAEITGFIMEFEDIVIPFQVKVGERIYAVTSIGKDSFCMHPNLTSITIPNSVTSIGRSTFSGCRGLTSITIPDSVTSIGDYAFSGCSGLTSATIPDSVTSILPQMFYNCRSLTSITIPDSVNFIDHEAFNGCSNLTSITIPDSVIFFGNAVFSNCSSELTITCAEGSVADRYAKTNGVNVKYTNEVTKGYVDTKESTENKTTILSSDSTDEQYPSAKAVVDYVAKNGGGNGVGQFTENGGEIFNDYENNQAISAYSSAHGENAKAGSKGFKIIAEFENNIPEGETGNITIQLNKVEGLTVGDACTLRVAVEESSGIYIDSIDSENNTVTLRGVSYEAVYETDADNPDTHTVENYIVVHGKPNLGDIDIGHNAFASGYNSLAQGRESFVAGRDNKVVGQYGAAFGRQNTVGYASGAFGRLNTVTGDRSVGFGQQNTVLGMCNVVGGVENSLDKKTSFSFVSGTCNTLTNAPNSSSFGRSNENKAENTATIGFNLIASSPEQVVVGRHNAEVDDALFVVGDGSSADIQNRHNALIVRKDRSLSINGGNSKGAYSIAIGQNAITNANNSVAIGRGATASGLYSISIGTGTQATGENACATGFNGLASGKNSFTANFALKASAANSFAAGYETIASGNRQFVIGCRNLEESNKAFIIGNGDADKRTNSNAFTVDWSGNGWVAGTVETDAVILRSSTEGSTKKFKITIDDDGILKATEVN